MSVHLLCGCMPLHLETFINAHLALRFAEARIHLRTGLFGDLEGNIQRARENDGDGAIVVIEWSDLDQRLGFRASAGWRIETLDDIVAQVQDKSRRLEAHLLELSKRMPVAVAAPGLGLPPMAYLPPSQTGNFEHTQDCSVRYGYAIAVNEVTKLTPHEFEERPVSYLPPSWRPDLLGTHTWNESSAFQVIDGIRYAQ